MSLENTVERTISENPDAADLLSLVAAPNLDLPALASGKEKGAITEHEFETITHIKTILELRATELREGALKKLPTYKFEDVSQSLSDPTKYVIIENVLKKMQELLSGEEPSHFDPNSPPSIRKVDEQVYEGWLLPGTRKRAIWSSSKKPYLLGKRSRWYDALVKSGLSKGETSQAVGMQHSSEEIEHRIITVAETAHTAHDIIENITSVALGVHWLTLKDNQERFEMLKLVTSIRSMCHSID